MKKLFFILPLLFSFIDPKIGGTIDIDQKVKIVNFEKIKLTVSLINKNQVVATTNIKMPKFPQAFVLTERHKLDPRSPFQGEFEVKAELFDELSKQKFEVLEKATVGKKDLHLIFK